jgi:tetratricopeptide (TPR) repeat protein
MSRLPPSVAKHLKRTPQPSRPTPAPGGIEDALRRAKDHHDKGEFEPANRLVGAVLARDPGNVRALLLAGSLARGLDDLGLAMVLFNKAVVLQPRSVEVRLVLASTCLEARRWDDAIRELERALALMPNNVEALGMLGRAYTQVGRAEAAIAMFERANLLESAHPVLRIDHAEALVALGRMDEAASVLQENIAGRTRLPASYLLLADIRKFSGRPAELDAILERLREPGWTDLDLVKLHHAAGKILNDIGSYDEAIDHFQQSKLLSGHKFDIGQFRIQVDSLLAAFKPAVLKSKSGFGNPSLVPVFIVGMPRSGTTLTEQVCASHPEVHGAGELDAIPRLIQRAGYERPLNGSIQKPVQALTVAESQAMAADYLRTLVSKAPDAARVIDKMPHNFMHVGMISLLFPHAKIIHCTRDPIDNCLSCFFNTFTKEHGYNSDLRTLGLYYREYHRLMEHWKALLPGRIYECNYETMIADQEAESRRLIEFLGLPWDDACLSFYETDRSVTTPSRWQVRQPIYKTSVKRWKKYGNKIQPLIEALGDLADV